MVVFQDGDKNSGRRGREGYAKDAKKKKEERRKKKNFKEVNEHCKFLMENFGCQFEFFGLLLRPLRNLRVLFFRYSVFGI
jgi:hypothetical protein